MSVDQQPASRDAAGILTIHLVRHGQTDWNKQARMQGQSDIPLNATGLRQADAAAVALSGRPIGAVIASDLIRARQTAEPIAAGAGVKLVLEPALRERSFGSAEGQFETEIDRQLAGRFRERWADPDFTFAGGETRRQLYQRVGAFLRDLLTSPPQGEIVLVAHGGTLQVARGFLEQIPVEQLPEWHFDNAGITTLTVLQRSAPPQPA
jgi:probable phosphoglycerate mutase